MSNPHLPAEILDHVVDHLHDTGDALRNCGLVSKLWIPRTRKHLFAYVRFQTGEDLRSWKETFPDPSTSPARYAKTLFVDCSRVMAAADAEAGGWIRGFSHVVHLRLNSWCFDSETSLVPLHGLSPAVKSLYADIPTFSSARVFDLVLSFPLLEDLDVSAREDGDSSGFARPSTSPTFTGSLVLLSFGMKYFARQLLSLPSGIHFRSLTLTWSYNGDLSLIMALVEECSHTLEYLNITGEIRGMCSNICVRIDNSLPPLNGPGSPSFDLSKATKLRNAVFRPDLRNAEWVSTALKTITPEHRGLQGISIYVPCLTFAGGGNARQLAGEAGYRQRLDLDRLLVQLWESHLIRPEAVLERWVEVVSNSVGRLLPEMTKRGIIDLVEPSACR